VATDLDKEGLDRAVAPLLSEDRRVETFSHDVSDRARWQRVVAEVVERHGRLDVLVNNAGTGTFASIEETTLEQWRQVMSVNLDGVFHGMQIGIAAMKKSGGVIVNVASIAANVAEPVLAAYSATRGGVAMLTKSAAVDCARRGYNIRINSIHPGYTDTKLVHDALATLGPEAAKFAESTVGAIPIGRLAEPAEIAGPIAFLASDDAAYMIGSELIVDGGYTAT
jgi:3alpha(or 20beta)-hydroxysteroid dehydrogenase